jgi:hypothetical protein
LNAQRELLQEQLKLRSVKKSLLKRIKLLLTKKFKKSIESKEEPTNTRNVVKPRK